MKKVRVRAYSRYNIEAVTLLGKQIMLGRKQCRWTESELARRAGISRATVQKIEKGDMTCAIGLVFETAALVGITLFSSDVINLNTQINNADNNIALLPKSIHKTKKKVDDDF
jgi:DNA-binding XRE family transcriptional regulator